MKLLSLKLQDQQFTGKQPQISVNPANTVGSTLTPDTLYTNVMWNQVINAATVAAIVSCNNVQ